MTLPTIPPGLAGKIVRNRPLLEPIRLQHLPENSARLRAKKKIMSLFMVRVVFRKLKLHEQFRIVSNNFVRLQQFCMCFYFTFHLFSKVDSVLPLGRR